MLISASVLVFAAGALWQVTPTKSAEPVNRQTFGLFPMEIGDWRGTAIRLDPTIERILAADDYLLADYQPQNGSLPVNLLVSFYASQTSGKGIHSPEVCIPGGGWEISSWTQSRVALPGQKSISIDVNRAIIRKGVEKALVYYWFEQRGRHMASDYLAKIYTVWDSMAYDRSDGALVRVVTSIAENESEASAERRLSGFMGLVVPLLPKFVPD